MASRAFELTGVMSLWIETIPEYQRTSIKNLLDTHNPSEVAEMWLSASGPANTATLGAMKAGADAFYDNVLSELKSLICTHDGYESERKQILGNLKAGRTTIVTMISITISSHVNVSPVLLAPVIAITLGILANSGSAGTCAALSELVKSREGKKKSDNSTG
jgi:hypothetical protein